MATLDTQRTQYEARLKDLLSSLGSGEVTTPTILPSRLSIINLVKAKLDELVPEGEGLVFKLSSQPNISDPYDLLINAHLDEATKDILMSAPLSVLIPTKSSTANGTPFSEGSTKGYIDLPANFLRLSQFKMVEWLTTVEKAITPEHPKYKFQKDANMCGGIAKPVAVLNWRNNSGTLTRTIEYYSVISSHAIDKLFYLHDMLAEDFVSANPMLLPSLAWMCAGKIMQILSMAPQFQMAMEQVKSSYYNL